MADSSGAIARIRADQNHFHALAKIIRQCAHSVLLRADWKIFGETSDPTVYPDVEKFRLFGDGLSGHGLQGCCAYYALPRLSASIRVIRKVSGPVGFCNRRDSIYIRGHAGAPKEDARRFPPGVLDQLAVRWHWLGIAVCSVVIFRIMTAFDGRV